MAADPATIQMIMSFLGGGSGGQGGTGLQGMGSFSLGALQTYMAMKGLRELQRTPRPQYTVSPEMAASQQRSAMRSKYGFTPQQTAQFRQQMGQSLYGDFRNQVNMGGGNLAQALAGRGMGARLGGLNRFAVDDANMMARNIQYEDTMNRAIQDQLNRGIAQRANYRMSDERAIGQSLQSGLTNMASAVNLNQATGAFGGGGAGAGAGGGGFKYPKGTISEQDPNSFFT